MVPDFEFSRVVVYYCQPSSSISVSNSNSITNSNSVTNSISTSTSNSISRSILPSTSPSGSYSNSYSHSMNPSVSSAGRTASANTGSVVTPPSSGGIVPSSGAIAPSSSSRALGPVCLKTRVPRTIDVNAFRKICTQALGGTVAISSQRRECCNGRTKTGYVITTPVDCSVPVSQLLTHTKGTGLRKRNRPFLLCRSLRGRLSCSNSIWTCQFP